MAPSKEDLLSYARVLGYRYLGLTGSGHRLVEHPVTGERRTLPFTPSDYRSIRNSRAELRRGAPRQMVQKVKEKQVEKKRRKKKLPREVREAQHQRARYYKRLADIEERNARAKEMKKAIERRRNGLG